MCLHLNERQVHPLEVRVQVLEQMLREAIDVVKDVAAPGQGWKVEVFVQEVQTALDNYEV